MKRLVVIAGVIALWALVPTAAVAQSTEAAQTASAHETPVVATQFTASSEGRARRGRDALALPAQLRAEDVSLETGLMLLRQSSGVDIAFSPSGLPQERRVSCDCDRLSVSEALDTMLEETELDYTQVGGQVIVVPDAAPRHVQSGLWALSTSLNYWSEHATAAPELQSYQPSSTVVRVGTVAGRVLSASRRPLSNVQISVPNSEIGTVTNAEGRYSLSNVPAGEVVIRAEMIGYGRQEQTVTVVDGESITVDFVLEEEALALDEIVVTGTAGQARRREVGNAIGQIDVSKVVESVSGVDELLQGRAAGVNVTMNSGQAGEGSKIRLRGNVSVSLSNQPLIYVDGVRVRGDGYPNIAPITGGQQHGSFQSSSPLDDINPNDIQRIEVIKGAAATTLYGTEAAAGVIQIFTKSGESGDPQWNLQVDQGIVTKNEFGFRESLNGEGIATEHEPRSFGDHRYMFLDPWLRNGWRQNYVLSVRGGTPQVRYFISGGAERNEGLMVNETEEKYSVRGNVGVTLTPNLTLDWNSSVNTSEVQNILCGNSTSGLCMNVVRAPDNYLGSADYDDMNRLVEGEAGTQIGRVIVGTTLQYQPSDQWSNKLTVGYDRSNMSGRITRPFDHVMVREGNQSSTELTSKVLSVDFTSTYAASLPAGIDADLSAGFQTATTSEAEIQAYAEGFPGPGLPTLSSGAITLARETRQRVITGGAFGQVLLKLRDRYFLTGGLRVDGNSAFGDEFGLQAYPKISGSWVISDEGYWPGALGTLKLRAAYGEAGRAPGAFDAVRTWTPVPYGSESAFVPLNLGNPTLGPERSREFELGFESLALGDRLTTDMTYYWQTTTDALIGVGRPGSIGGWASQLENVGTLKNHGLELTVEGGLFRGETTEWDLGVSLSTNHGKIVSLGGTPGFSVGAGGLARIEVGHPAPVMVSDKILNPDAKEDPDVDYEHYVGPNLPTTTIAPHTTLRLPGAVVVSARGEFQGGHYMRDAATLFALRTASLPPCYAAYAEIDAGNADNLTALERAWCIRDNQRPGYFIYPADFFKLRELSVQMPVSQFLPGPYHATLTLSGRNLFRWVNRDFRGWDPEQGGWSGINDYINDLWEKPAPGKVFTASLRVSF